MQVTNKIPIDQYFYHPDFQNKIPDLTHEQFIYKAGDNIYKPHDTGFVQLPNRNHTLKNLHHDISGENVLISTRFYYFGKSPLHIPDDVRPTIPVGQSAHGSLTHDEERAAAFISFVTEGYRIGIHDKPHKWPHNDTSWRII